MEMTEKKRVLIVHDEPVARESLGDWLSASGYEVATATDNKKAMELVRQDNFGVGILDIRFPGQDGMEILTKARQEHPDLKWVVITAEPTGEAAIEAIRLGAVEFLPKPFNPEQLEELVGRALGSGKTGVAKVSPEAGEVTKAEKKAITSVLEEKRVFPPPEDFQQKAAIRSLAEYKVLYDWSIKDPEGFWSDVANQLDWYKKWDKFLEYDFKDKPEVRYFVGGKINVSYNCVDRHLKTWRKNKAAIIWQGEPEGEVRSFTYQQLHYEVSKFANVLKKLGIKKGDTVSIYLPMIPELPIAMLACARIGAVHSVVFGGFSAESLRDRIRDCGSRLLITADGYYRSGHTVKSKDSADVAVDSCPKVTDVVVVKRLGIDVNMKAGRDHWWPEEMAAEDVTANCEPEPMEADSPLFILYTSGSTGRPKGVLHTQGGYLAHCYQSMKWTFDIKDEDTYWCTADIGWITGHSYIVYGPLVNGATTLMFEGVPTYPKPDRFWQIVEKFKVNIFYTAPTAIRSLMREGEDWPRKHDLSSLRLLGTVGEPINPRGLDVVPPGHRRREVPHRGYLVADRDRRHTDNASAWCSSHQAWLSHSPLPRG